MPQTKKCCNCWNTKPVSEFNKDKHAKDGLHASCKSCRIKPRRKADLYRKYGISSRQYEKLVEKQNGRCAICGKHQSELKTTLNVDHNHETGKVRGLLCVACNRLLGYAQDNQDILMKAIQYLEKKR
ncbi:endonuclease VII domain-containing protein [Candidatus Pacearchaeota archaeon]|nr:endonuclease VII domain-containing protein [Candidatus Pacearchaeota archaeon]